jgi:signal transduction histidine kinase
MIPRSLRHRVPFEISLIVLVTGLAIAGSVLWHDYQALRSDAAQNGQRLARLLSQALAPDLKTQGTWQAYKTLSAVYRGAEPSWLLPAFALVLDAHGRTRVASDPVRFPLAQDPAGLGPDRDLVLSQMPPLGAAGARQVTGRDWVYRIEPVQEGELVLGTLILAFSEHALWPRFYESAVRVLLTTGALLLLLLPVGWWIGWRIARPLMDLERCVARIGQPQAPPVACPAADPYQELGHLRARIEAVGAEIHQKRGLEEQVIRSERQAALGRLAAGIAHEINNPLGGMLTAIATYRRHGRDEQVARQTMSLLERGLDQIRHTVSALLVEVRAEPRNLGPSDVDDIAELVAPRLHEKALRLELDNGLAADLPLPAGPVRQILLNLALNGAKAAPAEGSLWIRVAPADGALHIRVANLGPAIPESQLRRLFEPFTADGPPGQGLGLWVIDQTVRQLGGRIQVVSTPEQTSFDVCLPLGVPL